jgi:TetR/AcrR family transcriptional repressor of nem operon
MPRDGTATRNRIMDTAEALILDQGFAATSVDRIIDRAGITKGAFFYHFASKRALALALVERFAYADRGTLENGLARAEAETADPREQVLRFVDGFIEEAEALTEPYPGCLFASYCYQAELFDARTHEVIRNAMDAWRQQLGAKFDQLMQVCPPAAPVEPAELADLITVIFEGAFIVSKTRRDPAAVAGHLRHYRQYLALLFPGPRP